MNGEKKEQGNGGLGKFEMDKPNLEVIKGLVAIVIGIIFVVLSGKVILGVLSLFAGLMLLYYGVVVLKITWITRSIDEIIKRFRGVLRI